MISTVCGIPINEEREELLERGTQAFPCAAYAGEVHQYITGGLPPHWHHEMEMFVLDEGEVRIITADGEFHLSKGDGYFVNSDVLHGIYPLTDKTCRFHSVVFHPSIIGGAPDSAFDSIYIQPFIKESKAIWPIYKNEAESGKLLYSFEKAWQACASEIDGYEFTVREAFSKIILALKNSWHEETSARSIGRESRIKDMMVWISKHYMEPVTVAQMSQAAGISIRECQRSFSTVLDTTPIQYLTKYRIYIAAKMLQTTELQVTEIALHCGFENPSYFTKTKLFYKNI